MITKFTIFNSSYSFKEELNDISNKKYKIVFMKKGQFAFIALSKKANDTISLSHSQLEDNLSKMLSAIGGTENLLVQY